MTTNIIKDGLPLSPSRDLGHLFIPALRESFRLLDQVRWATDIAELADSYGTDEADLSAAVETFMASVQQFTGNPEVTTVDVAMTTSGFTSQPLLPRLILFATLGEVLTAGFFIAVREMTFSGSIPPTSGSMIGMLAAGHELCCRLHGMDHGCETAATETAANIERAAVAELQAARLRMDGLLGQLSQLQDCKAREISLLQQLTDYKTSTAKIVEDSIQLYRELSIRLQLELNELKRPWWQRLVTRAMRWIGR